MASSNLQKCCRTAAVRPIHIQNFSSFRDFGSASYMNAMRQKEVQLVICGAGPARDVTVLVDEALKRGWAVQPIATPSALSLGLVDVEAIERKTGRFVLSTYSPPGQRRTPKVDAIIVAPATANTISKLSLSIADTFAASLLNESVGNEIPVVILPSLKKAHADRLAFKENVDRLRREGVKVLLGQGGVEPTNASSKDGPLPPFPWHLAIEATEALLSQNSVL